MKVYTISINGYYLTKKENFQHTGSPKLLTLKEAKIKQEVYELLGCECKIINTRNTIDQTQWEEVQ